MDEQPEKSGQQPGGPSHAALDRTGAATLLALLLGLLCLRHLAAYLGDAGTEHFEELMVQLSRYGMGTAGLGPDRGGGITGGGQLYFILHELVRRAGLPFSAGQVLHLALEAAALLGWLWLAPRTFSRALVWCVGLALVLYDVPKLYLMENSTLVALATVPLFALVAAVLDRWSWRAALGAALFMGLSANLGVIALSVLPALAVTLWLQRNPRGVGLLTLLGGAAGVALLPQLLAPFGGGSLLADIGDAVLGLGPVGALQSIATTLGRYLWDAPLLLGLVLLWRSPPPRLRLVIPWLLLATLPVSLLDLGDQGELYHFAASSPARAMVVGAGILWCVRLLERVSRGRWGWPSMLGAVIVACGVITVAPLALQGFSAHTTWRGVPAHTRCSASDSGKCSHRQIEQVLEGLARAGVTPAPHQDVTFHGAYAPCLNGAWTWRRSQLGQPARARGPGRHILLLTRQDRLDATHLPGARQAGELMAVEHVRPLDVRLVQSETRTPGSAEVEVRGMGRGMAWIALDSAAPLHGLEVTPLAQGPEVLATVRCADRHGPDAPAVIRTGAHILLSTAAAGAAAVRLRVKAPGKIIDAVHGVRIP